MTGERAKHRKCCASFGLGTLTEPTAGERPSPQSKAYRERKARLQAEWRERIFKRDENRCRACGRVGSPETLHLAHITSALAFVRYTGVVDAMDQSYRDDNLVTLCSACHKFQHRDIVSDFDIELKKLLDRKDEMKTIPAVQEWLELNRQIGQRMEANRSQGAKQRQDVDRLFRQIRATRGWEGAAELIQRTGGVPTWADLGYVASSFCRDPGGGPTARSRVAAGFCTWHSRSCAGPLTKCRECRLPYCEYHTPLHRL